MITAIRKVTGLGLRDAKNLADGAPSLIACGRERATADEIATSLEQGGAVVSVQPCPGHHPS